MQPTALVNDLLHCRYRLFNAVRVMTRIAHLNMNCDSHDSSSNNSMMLGSSLDDEDDVAAAAAAEAPPSSLMKSSPSLVNVAGSGLAIKREDTVDFSQLSDLPPFVHEVSSYYQNFEKLHLIVNNGLHGTVFSVQRIGNNSRLLLQGNFGAKVCYHY